MPLTEIFDARLDPRVRMFDTPEVSCFAVLTSSHAIIVDTFGTPEEALEMIHLLQPNLENRQLLVINTHQHWDHVWGNSIFASNGIFPAPILAHIHAKDELEMLQKELLEKQASDSRFAHVQILPPNIYIENAFIDAGELTLELVPTFGHAHDQIAIWIPEIETLLAADALEFPFPYGNDVPQLLVTMHDLQELKPRVVLPCHGGIHDASLITKNLEYFAWLKKQIRIGEKYTFTDALEFLQLDSTDKIYADFHKLNIAATQKILASREH